MRLQEADIFPQFKIAAVLTVWHKVDVIHPLALDWVGLLLHLIHPPRRTEAYHLQPSICQEQGDIYFRDYTGWLMLGIITQYCLRQRRHLSRSESMMPLAIFNSPLCFQFWGEFHICASSEQNCPLVFVRTLQNSKRISYKWESCKTLKAHLQR